MVWCKDSPPPAGVSVLIRLKDGSVHEGHYIKNANKFIRNVNRYRIYKFDRRTFESSEVVEWAYMPS